MGTDILIYGERKVKGKWQLVAPLEENEEYDPDYPDSPPEYKPVEIYTGRNRNLFAILCGLANPAFSVEGFAPIALPRGLPADISAELADWVRYWEEDGHTYSWLSLKELVEFGWANKTVHLQGLVDPELANLFEKEKPFPREQWPPDIPVSYGMVQNYSNYVAGSKVRVEWLTTYEEIAHDFLIEAIRPLAEKFGASEDVRLVFWFD